MVVRKEAAAGGIMGAALGLLIWLVTFLWRGLPRSVAATVAVSLPVVSVWANVLGGAFPLLSAYLGYNPAGERRGVSAAPCFFKLKPTIQCSSTPKHFL
jgi:Mg/Co/Ni transporter MgtE